MGILEEVIQLKNRGVPENSIVQSLQERGISPKDISDALNQAQIKNAISDVKGEETMDENIPQPEIQQESYQYPEQDYGTQQDYYQPQQEQTYVASGGYDTETIIEISEQVFSDKISELLNQLRLMNEFRSITQVKLEQLDSRLKKVESIIDKLQISILDKIGSYGENIDTIKKEMSMMQDTFSKVVDPLTELKSLNEKRSSKKK